VNDAVCSCTYPRCFAGKLVSEYSIMSPKGEGLKLKGLLKVGGTHVKVDELFPALEAKLKGCCESKTRAFIDYAREKCGEKQLGEVCASTPNGYEPRFDGEGLGADMRFPKKPCVAEAWAKFALIDVTDKSTDYDADTEINYSAWLKNRCSDDNVGVKRDSAGQVQNCAAAAVFCQDQTHGTMAQKNCPETCGLCLKPTSGPRQLDIELDDALAGKAAVHQAAWTLTPSAAQMTHTPTTDQACFVNPESFDCGCMATMKRNCRDKSFRKQIETSSVTECYEFFVCTHSQTCRAYKDRHCKSQLNLLKTLQQRKVTVETC